MRLGDSFSMDADFPILALVPFWPDTEKIFIIEACAIRILPLVAARWEGLELQNSHQDSVGLRRVVLGS